MGLGRQCRSSNPFAVCLCDRVALSLARIFASRELGVLLMKLPTIPGLRWKRLGIIGLSAALGLFLLVRCSARAQDKAIVTATAQGRAEQQADDLTTTLNRTMEAINADEALRRDPAVRHDQCVRHARNPDDC